MINKRTRHALSRVLFVSTLVVFMTSLCFLILGDLSGKGKLAYGLIAISSFFTSLSFFLQLKQERGAGNNKFK